MAARCLPFPLLIFAFATTAAGSVWSGFIDDPG
jgi:hypothetical protein